MINNKDFRIVATDGEIDLVQAVNPDENMEYYLDIYLHNTDELVGDINFRLKTETYNGNVGYNIFEEYRGKKYASKALLLLRDFLNKRGFQNLVVAVIPENIASVKTVTNAGGKLFCSRMVPEKYAIYRESPSHQVSIYHVSTEREEKKR